LNRSAWKHSRQRGGPPDLAEAVVERLVGHDELAETAEEWIASHLVERRERAHGEPLDQHLHADDLLVDHLGRDELPQQLAQGVADGEDAAPEARGDVAREGVDVARLLADLVRRVFLGPGIEEEIAQARRQTERPLLPVQQVRHGPACALVRELRPLPLVEAVPRRGVRLDDEAEGKDRLLGQRLGEVHVVWILGVPEVLLGAPDDLLEVGRAPRVARGVDHGGEVVARDGLVGGVERHGFHY
jgi:hypothetical protein